MYTTQRSLFVTRFPNLRVPPEQLRSAVSLVDPARIAKKQPGTNTSCEAEMLCPLPFRGSVSLGRHQSERFKDQPCFSTSCRIAEDFVPGPKIGAFLTELS